MQASKTIQSTQTPIILLAYSGHGMVVAEAAHLAGMTIAGYADKQPAVWNELGLAYLGDERSNDFVGWQMGASFILGIGSNTLRSRVAAFILGKQGSLVTVIHPQALVSGFAKVEAGAFIGRGAMVNPNAYIGHGAIVNTGAIVEHDCSVGDYAHIAPGAVLAGNVRVGGGAMVGANTVIREGITIGRNVMIGAGSVVVKDVPYGVKVFGNPAKPQGTI